MTPIEAMAAELRDLASRLVWLSAVLRGADPLAPPYRRQLHSGIVCRPPSPTTI